MKSAFEKTRFSLLAAISWMYHVGTRWNGLPPGLNDGRHYSISKRYSNTCFSMARGLDLIVITYHNQWRSFIWSCTWLRGLIKKFQDFLNNFSLQILKLRVVIEFLQKNLRMRGAVWQGALSCWKNHSSVAPNFGFSRKIFWRKVLRVWRYR